MKLRLSDHAKKRMFERGISLEEVKEIISRGQKWRENSTVHARMRGIEVVYKIVNSDVFVITVYYG
jgi:hypothetical protein